MSSRTFAIPSIVRGLTRGLRATQTSRGRETGGAGPSRSHPATWGHLPRYPAPGHTSPACSSHTMAAIFFKYLYLYLYRLDIDIYRPRSFIHIHLSIFQYMCDSVCHTYTWIEHFQLLKTTNCCSPRFIKQTNTIRTQQVV